MGLAIMAVIAGLLSVLAPCVLPVLPVILGGSLTDRKRRKPLVIVGSTVLSIVVFTVLLKASTLLLSIDPSVWTYVSAAVIVVYGLTLLFPHQWDRFRTWCGLDRANNLATASDRYTGIWSDIVLGASLGPIFASCSPTYALLISIIFPQSFILGVLYTLLYALGFGAVLLAIVYGGRAMISSLSTLTNPYGRFKKILGLLLVVTGVLIATGLMKKIEIAVLDAGWFDVGALEENILDQIVGNEYE